MGSTHASGSLFDEFVAWSQLLFVVVAATFVVVVAGAAAVAVVTSTRIVESILLFSAFYSYRAAHKIQKYFHYFWSSSPSSAFFSASSSLLALHSCAVCPVYWFLLRVKSARSRNGVHRGREVGQGAGQLCTCSSPEYKLLRSASGKLLIKSFELLNFKECSTQIGPNWTWLFL